MSQTTYDICGVQITPTTIKAINTQILEAAWRPYTQPLVIFKPYVEFLAVASQQRTTQDLLNSADVLVADATSIQWAGAYLYGKPRIHTNLVSTFWSLAVRLQSHAWRSQIFSEKMAGIDQTTPLLVAVAKTKLKVGIVGGPRDTAHTQEVLSKQFGLPNLKVWSGYFDQTKETELVKGIAECKLDILFIAMGFPKQEEFIVRNKATLQAKVLIGEGGSFEYQALGGPVHRAPAWIRKIGFEWLWRLLGQPKRLKRQLAIPQFIFAVRRQKIALKSTSKS